MPTKPADEPRFWTKPSSSTATTETGDCPVCGRSSALNEVWHCQAEAEAQALRKEAAAAEKAHRALRDAERVAQAAATPLPPSLLMASELGVDADAVQLAWSGWHQVSSSTGEELANHLETQAPELKLALELFREQAQQKLAKREDQWRPMALSLAEWLPAARQMQSETETVKHLKAAEDWVRTTTTAIRNERFQPIKEKVKGIWELLRTRSSVELEDVTFEGKATSPQSEPRRDRRRHRRCRPRRHEPGRASFARARFVSPQSDP